MLGDPLHEREIRALWYLAEGLTYQQVGRKMALSEQGAKSLGRTIMAKVGGRNITHTVHLAHCMGLIGTRPTCGSRAGVASHQYYGEEMCVKCRIFWRPYRRGIKQRAREKARSETKISGG